MSDLKMPTEYLARVMDFVNATHAALRIGVYAGELRRRLEAAVVEEAILPSVEDPDAASEQPCRCTSGFTCTPCLYAREQRAASGQGQCESPAGRLENEQRKALAIMEARLRNVARLVSEMRTVPALAGTVRKFDTVLSFNYVCSAWEADAEWFDESGRLKPEHTNGLCLDCGRDRRAHKASTPSSEATNDRQHA